MLVLVGDLDVEVVGAHPGVRERIQARCLAAKLDRELARGVPPEASVALALRAQRLVRPRMRRQLACSLRRILAEADHSGPRVAPALTTQSRRRIRAAAESIEAVAEQLQRRAPVSSRGVAQVCLLLCDGSGPIHGGGTARDLIDRLQSALGALDPLPGW